MFLFEFYKKLTFFKNFYEEVKLMKTVEESRQHMFACQDAFTNIVKEHIY